MRSLLGLAMLIWFSSESLAKRPRPTEVVPVEVVTPDPTPPPPPTYPLPQRDLHAPTALGPLPNGLASASAQGCGACHTDVTRAWRGSAHAQPPTQDHLEMAQRRADPGCTTCHLPLQRQHPSEQWSPTLASEAVTCVTCHVDDGRVLVSALSEQSPHTDGLAPDLKTDGACTTCHEYTKPGMSVPLYDTVSSWRASPYAAAGIGCQDCHTHAGAEGHGLPLSLHEALTALVEMNQPALVRGKDNQTVQLTLQNTGAGHTIPSGSPWSGLELGIVLQNGDRTRVTLPWTTMLAREVDATDTISGDNRLHPGETKTFTIPVDLDVRKPAGRWRLSVEAWHAVNGTRVAAAGPEWTHTVQIHVE